MAYWRRLGEEPAFVMQRFVCSGVFRQTSVLLQISPVSHCHTRRMQDSPSHRSLKQLISSQRWLNSTTALCSPTSQKTSASGQEEPDPLHDKSSGLIQRFKKTFKQYGKVMIPVHLLTSTMWFGTFYYAAMKWVDQEQNLVYLVILIMDYYIKAMDEVPPGIYYRRIIPTCLFAA